MDDIDHPFDAHSAWAKLNHVNQAIRHLKQKRKYIYSNASPCFHADIFLEQFFQHTFFPISTIYMYHKYGSRAVINQTPWSIIAFTMTNLYWIIILITCFSYQELKKHGITSSELVISLMTGTVFRCVVSSKYASMSWEEYLKYLTCENEHDAKEMQIQMQLITGWFYVDVPFCAHEAELAMRRMGFYKNASPPPFELLKKHLSCWRSILGENENLLQVNACPRSDAVHVDCSDLIALIVSANNPKMKKKYLVILAIPIGIFFSLIPGIVRVSCEPLSVMFNLVGDNLCQSKSFLGDGVYANIVSLLLMAHTSYSIGPLTLFFLVTFIGNIRHYKACRIYGLLVRADIRSPPLTVCPILNLQIPNNIRAWVRSRLALHFFGMRYYQRMDIYAKLCAAILVVMMIWLYIYAQQISTTNENGTAELMIDLRYWIVCYLLIVWGFSFGAILAVLAATNEELKKHEIEFLLHRLTIREQRKIKQTNLFPNNSMMTSSSSSSFSSLEDVEIEETCVDNLKEKQLLVGNEEKDEYDHYSGLVDPNHHIELERVRRETDEPSSATTENDIWFEEVFCDKQTDLSLKSKFPISSPPTSSSTTIEPIGGVEEEEEGDPDQGESAAELKRIMSHLQLTGSAAVQKEELDDLMDTAVMITEAQMRVNPRRFIGADASWNFLVSYVAAWGALIGFTLSIASIDYGA